tara:strand:- start:660 stop:866 length:207 start_codon:yes stop_codon:yes gene_type:complete
MDEKTKKQKDLKTQRIKAVKKILSNPIKEEVRKYWTKILRQLDPWKQESIWAKNLKKTRLKRNGSRTF